jgi:2-polyprenyl-6-methoxyphenol hydroxylase-like FAD-dependent oxidoreductase
LAYCIAIFTVFDMGSLNPPPFSKILIVGAGPAGLLLSLLIAQSGIPSTVLEAWSHTDERLRASQYGTPATRIFRRAGILDDIRAVSVPRFPAITWRRTSTHEKVAGIDLSVTAGDEDRMTVLPLNQILEIMLKHCRRYPELIDIRFSHEVVEVGQGEKSAWVVAQVGVEKQRFEADYVVGCDGGRSIVRKSLFGQHWPGETFDFKLMNQNVSLQSPRMLNSD